MRRIRRQPKLLTGLAWVAIFATLLLAGVLGRAWALPGRAPLGQTIPPPPTATPTNTVSAQPSATWTPRPTWTRVATQPPEPPTVTPTATHVAVQETATFPVQTPGATATSAPSPTPTLVVLHLTPQSTNTVSGPLPTAGTPSAPPPTTPALEPIPLVLEVVAVPQVAGPRDAVQFILQVANVGYEPVNAVQVEVVFADDLRLQFVECSRCTTDCPLCNGGPPLGHLRIFIGRLPPGDQVIAPVHVQVAEDAWPGRTLRTDWTLTAIGLPAQAVQAGVVLPWAPLPATGG